MRLVVERGTPLAELREEVEARRCPWSASWSARIRHGEDDAELVLGKGSREEELLSLMDGLRGVSGVREVDSSGLTNGSAESTNES